MFSDMSFFIFSDEVERLKLPSVSTNTLTVPVSGTNGFNAISNNYTVASGTFLQIVKKNDPDYVPASFITDMDSIVRTSVKNLIGQIDYSS